jgi:AcrR family transcriptional regulator
MAVANRTKWTAEKRGKFLSELRQGASIARAAAAVGVSRSTVYEYRSTDEAFATEWDQAVEDGTDTIEDEAYRRAVEGVDEPVFYKGDEVGHVRKYSDTLLIVLLKARRPEKYLDRSRQEVGGVNGGAITIQVVRSDDAEK